MMVFLQRGTTAGYIRDDGVYVIQYQRAGAALRVYPRHKVSKCRWTGLAIVIPSADRMPTIVILAPPLQSKPP